MPVPKRVLVCLIGVALACFAGTAWGAKDDTPKVTGTVAQDVTAAGATLKGTVNPDDKPTTYFFEYGTTTAYGTAVGAGSLPKSKSNSPVSVAVTGLEPDVTYHFRLVATNDHGDTTRGPDTTFTTLTGPSDPGGDPGSDPGTDPGADPGSPGLKGPTVAEAVLGKSVLVAPATGELRVKAPGADGFVPLELGSKIPVGSEIDARHGSIALTSALPSGATQTGYFGAGRFKLKQDKRGYVDLYMTGNYCSRATASAAGVTATAAAKKKKGRRLWGRDHGGRFRTHGRNSHATVRGTRWLVVDTCKGTYTRVSSGVVVVRDKVRKKRVVLRAGEHYLARPRH